MFRKTPLRRQSLKAKEQWDAVRKKVIERDKGRCQICGKPGTQVHHIHLRSKRRDLLYNTNNLILLCDRHHFHRGSEHYREQCELIAMKKGMSVEQLLKEAEKDDGKS